MSDNIKEYEKYENETKDVYFKSRDKDITKLIRWNSISELKSYYSNELLPIISKTNNQIAEIETDIGNSSNDAETETLRKLLVTQNNRLKKLTYKNLETQNLINSATNRLSKNRDFGILALSILISSLTFFYSIKSSNSEVDKIQSEVKKSNSESTKQLELSLEEVLNQLKEQEKLNEQLLLKIDSLKLK
jgi:predicted PurR-regulated permease PerM